MMELWNIEKSCFDKGLQYICGVDEAGAGPLAGPVYAAAVILPPYCEIEGLNDSKKLTEKKREKLFRFLVGRGFSPDLIFKLLDNADY